MTGIRYHSDDPARNDLDLQAREISIAGKGGTARTVKIGHQAAPQPGPLPAGPRPAHPGAPAAAVAGRRQPGGR